VGLVLDKGGVDDKSFNASAFRGAAKARDELGVELKYVEVSDDAQMEPMLKNFAQKKFDLIIAIGFSQQEAMKRAAEANPGSRFAIVDAFVDQPNVSSLLFKEHEGSFLAGAAAALKSKTGVIGFVGGMDVPMIRRFELGYQEGAKRVNKDIKVISNFVGVTSEAWNNPTKAKELALSQISQKADVIFHAAGASGLGVFDAVEEMSKGLRKVYAIGVDSNQNWVKPGLILTSMLKRVDVAVFDTIKSAQAQDFKAGQHIFGLPDSGIDLSIDENNKEILDASIISQIEKLKSEIISAKISVPDYYSKKK
jgi:basic membrane protein A